MGPISPQVARQNEVARRVLSLTNSAPVRISSAWKRSLDEPKSPALLPASFCKRAESALQYSRARSSVAVFRAGAGPMLVNLTGGSAVH